MSNLNEPLTYTLPRWVWLIIWCSLILNGLHDLFQAGRGFGF